MNTNQRIHFMNRTKIKKKKVKKKMKKMIMSEPLYFKVIIKVVC